MESLGSGIARIIGPCRKAGLPTPLFEHRGAAFVVTILKNRWTKAALSSLGLSERQIAAVEHVKANGAISSRQYVSLTGVPRRTAIRELQRLVAAQVFVARGEGTFLEYALKIDCATSVPIVSPESAVHRTKSVSTNKIKGRTKGLCKSTPQESGTDAKETPQDTPQVALQVKTLVEALQTGELSAAELRKVIGIAGCKDFRERYLDPAVSAKLVEMTIPDKPTSRLQRYRLTDRGRSLAAQLSKKKGGRK